MIDVRYTCDADNSSPELRWSSPPDGTETFALIMDDPDAPNGSFIHWVVYSIPGEVRHLPAGIPPQDSLPNKIRQGINGARKLGYFGPCPPQQDAPHRYRWTLYALRGCPPLEGKLQASTLLDKIRPHIIGTAIRQGVYRRATRQAG